MKHDIIIQMVYGLRRFEGKYLYLVLFSRTPRKVITHFAAAFSILKVKLSAVISSLDPGFI